MSRSDAPGPEVAGPSALGAVRRRVEADPGAVAVEHVAASGSESTGGRTILSYGELWSSAGAVALDLRDRGVGPDRIVAVVADRSVESVVATLGILRAGAAYLPIDPVWPAERSRFMLEDADAPPLLTRRSGAVDAPAGTVEIEVPAASALVERGAAIDASPLGLPAADHLAYLLYTSGSTGRPKGILMEHGPLDHLVAWQRSASAGRDARTLHFTSLCFDPSWLELVSTWAAGGTLVLIEESERTDPFALLRFLDRERITRLFMPPLAVRHLAEAHATTRVVPTALRQVNAAGEQLRITPQVTELFHALPDAVLVNQYGPAETQVVTAHRLGADPRSWPALPPIGRALPSADIHLLGDEGRPVRDGEAGEIWIGGDCLGRGYLNRPEETAARFVARHPSPDGPGVPLYRTGDLARREADGTLAFLGRADRQVKIRGYRVEPEEVEVALEELDGVGAAAVAAREDSTGSLALVAWVVPERTDAAIDETGIRRRLEKTLPEYMVPVRVQRIDALPLTPSGKVDRASLPEPGTARPDLEYAYAEPRHGLERTIAEVWAEVLGVDRVGVRDNFFDLGGTSALALPIATRLSDELGREIPILALFEHPTVAALAEQVAGGSDPAERRGTTPSISGTPTPAGDPSAARDPTGDPEDRAVAVVGMECRLPGAASVEDFWRNLVDEVDSITRFTRDQLRGAGIEPDLVERDDFVGARGMVEDPGVFDAAFFGYSPREARLMDPQQRLFLETCWKALESGGYAPDRAEGRVGVWGGLSTGMEYSTYLLSSLRQPGVLGPGDALPTMLGNAPDYLTTRVSYKLDLSGPSVNVQSACSTSLVAICEAVRSLRRGDCDMALAGGVSVAYPRVSGYLYQEGGIQSPDGRCRPFDADAAGTVFSDGVAVVLLKRLADAKRDGDTIHAVIRGVATNNDGASKVSFSAPSVEGQAAVVRDALADGGVPSDTIGYVETHGTATRLGDPLEVRALAKAFEAGDAREPGRCAIGSVKSNIGHTVAAAGAASLIKAVLALREGVVPASLHVSRPNPEIEWDRTPFRVQDRTAPWSTDGPRRAGVSSFGIGGTNAHVVLEAPPEREPSDPGRRVHLLVASGHTPAAADEAAARLADALEAHPELPLADVAHTSRVGRSEQRFRRAAVGRDRTAIAASLRSAATEGHGGAAAGGSDAAVSGKVDTPVQGVTFLFPGGGAQYAGMARELYEEEPVFRQWLDRCAELLGPETPILDALYPPEAGGEPVDLEAPAIALPCLFGVEYALARLWTSWGVRPEALVGHSLGEYTAAALSGVMSLEDALTLVVARARLFETLPVGSMTAVPLTEEELGELIAEPLSIAAVNGPTSCVVSGPTDAIEAFEARLEERGVEGRRVRISVAAHSEMVESILDDFRAVAETIELRPPRIPCVSNVTGDWLTDEDATDPGYWVRHLRRTVRFADGLATVLADHPVPLVEIGPGRILTSLARLHPDTGPDSTIVGSIRHPDDDVSDLTFLLRSLATLWANGLEVDWRRFVGGERRHQVPLPTYPFQGERYEIDVERPTDPPVPSAAATPPAPSSAALGVPTPTSAASPPAATSNPNASPRPRDSAMPRRDRILWKLKSVVHDLSGIPVEEQDEHASFLEMGFDSLFLTQASLGFQRAFDVRVTFRQLFDEAPTLDALAGYIDGQLADDVTVEGPPGSDVAAPQAASGPAARQLAAGEGPGTAQPRALPASFDPGRLLDEGAAGNDLLRQMLQMQIQTNNMLLAAMSGQAPPEPQGAPVHAAATPQSEGEEEAGSHGPFRPVEKGRMKSGFDDRQQAFLDDVVDRYLAKTKSSKELTRAHRDAFADPRAVAGFRQEWKEIVYPIAVDRSKGSKMRDIDGNEYVDAVSGFGAIFFGHAPDFVVEAVDQQLHQSLDYGPLSTIAGEVAEMVCEATGMDRASFCNTGSEAVLAAMRTARTATGRDTIVKFNGSYHGIFDEVLVRRQDFGSSSRNVPVAPGIPREASQHIEVLDYGAPEALERIRELGPELAGILVEPVQSRNPALQPREFLHDLRELCTELGVPLIFDEIITGFRVHPRGAQGWFGVQADIASYGKVVGGGMPIGIVAGKKRFMDALDGGTWRYGDDSFPEAGVTYFAGTFIRHPLSLSAVRAVMKHLRAHGSELQDRTNARTVRLAAELNEHFARERLPIRIEHFGSVFLPRFGGRPELDTIFHRLLHLHGLHLWEGRPGFLTTAHTEQDVDRIVEAFRAAADEMADGGLLERDPPRERTVVPFTEPQEEIWVAMRLNPGASPAYNEPVRLAMQGTLHLPALRHAVGRLVRRHDALRATVSATDEALVVHPTMEVDVPFVDLSGLDPEERERERERHALEESTTPFDLERGPLLRVKVIKLEEERWELLATVHHLACDGWSITIALRDLSRFYSAAVTGRALELEPAMGLAEYRAWYEEQQEAVGAREARAYWLDRFEELPPVAELPLDRPRPAEKTYHGERQSLVVPAATVAALKKVASEHRCTLFTVMFATFNVLLHRLTGQRDLVVGVPSAGQAALGENELVAHCVHYLPIRTDVDSAAPFTAYLDRLRETVLDANSHSELTFGSLIKELSLPRDRSRIPLLAAGFNLDPAMSGFDFHGLDWRYDPMPRRHCKLELAVNVVEQDGSLLVEIDHNTDVIDRETALAWAHAWIEMLDALIEEPSRPIDRLELPLEGDGRARADQDDARGVKLSGVGADAAATVHGLIEAAADRVPDRPAVEDERGERLTYAELEARANRLANHLRGRGVATESVVAVDLPRGVDLVATLVAIHKAGGAYLPIDDQLPAERIRFMLADAGAKALVTVSGRAERAGDFDGAVVLLDDHADEIGAGSTERPDADVTPSNLAYVIYTSGSTGTPKGVETTHANVTHLLRGTDADVPLVETDVMLAVTTVAFDQSVLQLFAPLAHGGSVFVADAKTVADGRRLAELIDRSDANIMKATPAVWRILVDAGWQGKADLRAFSGGEALPEDLARRLATLCAEAWNHYGPTETTGHTTSWRIPEAGGPVRIGTPLPGARVFVLDENLQPRPPGAVGELFVGGPGVARGYRNRPELTAERFVRDPFSDDPDARLYRTGDLCRRHDDGTLEYIGRTDAQVKIRGFRIELGEIEAVLRSHPAVADAAARVWDGGTIDARLVGYVVLAGRTDAPPPTGSELRAFLRDRLPDYMVPGLVVDVARLPLTPRGKLDRLALPDPLAGPGDEAEDEGEPETALERLVADVWAGLLDVAEVRRRDNFFEIGGHSLLAVRAATRLTERTGVEVDPRSLFFQTVEQLARSIEERAGSGEMATARE